METTTVKKKNYPCGKKGRSGRRPKAITVLKRQLVKDKQESALYAFSLFDAVMRAEDQPLKLRLEAAHEVLDRVLGKPAQMTFNAGEETYRKYLAGLEATLANTVERPGGGTTGGSENLQPGASGLPTTADSVANPSSA